MAIQRYPSAKWIEIVNIKDEEEQSKTATEYVMSLEEEISILKKMMAGKEYNARMEVVNSVMKLPAFKEWLRFHDDKEFDRYSADWSGDIMGQ